MGDRQHRGWRRLLRENWYRDVWLLLVSLVLLLMVHGVQSRVERQREGRAIAINVMCGGISSVIEAGRATITGSSTLSPEFERNLERLGYPPERQRKAAARAAAKGYAASIAAAVQQESGVRGLVRKDGSLNCERLRQVTHVIREPAD